MSVDPPHETEMHGDDSIHCWCCGRVDDTNRMVHLGDHPEVHLCLGCAHAVHQQAWEIEDGGRRGPAHLIRGRMRSLRSVVIERGWHENRFVGARLRSLDRYIP